MCQLIALQNNKLLLNFNNQFCLEIKLLKSSGMVPLSNVWINYLSLWKAVSWDTHSIPVFIFLSCFIKCLHFVRLKVLGSCQECLGEGAAIAVPAWCTVGPAKVCVWIYVWWCVVGYVNVVSSSECRSIRWAAVYSIAVGTGTIVSWWWQFNRRPAWLVDEWKQKRFWIVVIVTTGNLKGKDTESKNVTYFRRLLQMEVQLTRFI